MTQKTRFVSRGRLNGVVREPGREDRPGAAARSRIAEQPVDEAVYYRARLILGESLRRPGR
jgi:hypothetical protein